MESNTRASRAGGILLIAVLVILALLFVLYFLEFILLGAFIALVVVLLITIAACFLTGIIAIPMYIMKDTTTKAGDYSMDSVKSVEGEKKRKEE
ncbi:hypothetical protein [Methanoplanus endosymbiosus]|uniref:Uncharacterized protein n=1 Tax=Methanoplanus endosymbiosus TaxID=33865 RepID=A0A9E7PR16_9EURY|nr:hypothetical protein [Methanoplanus endosymbiosus]UUX91912.1 hypothetical protein L6E24_11165 [Methanoplanus endosymbiosus]